MTGSGQPPRDDADATPSFVGVDLGGTQLRAAAVDPAGGVLNVRRVATSHDGPDAVIAQIEDLIADVRLPNTRGVGIGLPCALDGRTGVVPAIPALAGWEKVPLVALLTERARLPVTLENDAKCATIGEWRRGAARGSRNFVYVTISTGIGAGVVAENVLIRGRGGLAGEIGHTKIADETMICDCGQRGCWQTIASGTALAHAAALAIADNPRSVLAEVVGGQKPDGRHVQVAVRHGCPIAAGVLRGEARALALGFTNIQHLYDPAMIVVGGGVSHALPLMLDEIRTVMHQRLLPAFSLAQIVPAQLGDDAGIIGAALLASGETKPDASGRG